MVFLLVLLFAFQMTPIVHAGSFMDKFIDPKDKKFDVSDWLLKHKGFLPVPQIITEPAVGFGVGLALLFFHQSMDEKIAQQQIDTGETVNGKKEKLLPAGLIVSQFPDRETTRRRQPLQTNLLQGFQPLVLVTQHLPQER